MKNLLLILAFFLLISATPTSVRKADQAKWLQYSAYCRQMVQDTLIQYGVKRFDHQWIAQKDFSYLPCENCQSIIIHEGEPYYEWKHPIDTVWWIPTKRDYLQNSLRTAKSRTYYADLNQVFISRPYIYMVRQRRATVKDFYEHYMLGNLDYKKVTDGVNLVNKLKLVK